MPFNKDVYRALEDIVGPENISDDPMILDAYAFTMGPGINPEQPRFAYRPVAAVLPGSAEEVQAIVKVCNRYRAKFHAYSTGWGPEAACQEEGLIQLDLRRMDRILEIDEKNMFAVVEPYVVCGTLQAEAMKLGLNAHMHGAGASVSPLASATSFQGPGPDSHYLGHSAENLLAIEWVMPNGEILRTGSLGSRTGWFCGEGPGPSTRGIARGHTGHKGSLGVFTKCAVRLSPWPGPPVMPVEGTVPAYVSPLPKNFRAYTLAFPTWQAYADACYKIYDADIGYLGHRQFSLWGTEMTGAVLKLVTDPTRQLRDLEDLLEMPQVKKMTEEMKVSFQFIIAGMTMRDTEYQDKALDEILAEVGGWKVQAMLEPTMHNYTLLFLLRLCFKNLNGLLGISSDSFSQLGNPDYNVKYIVPTAMEVLEKHQKTGLLSNTGPDNLMGHLSKGGGGGSQCLEGFYHYDPTDAESRKESRNYLLDCVRVTNERKELFPGMESWFFPFSDKVWQERFLSSPQPDIYRWQRKIKEAIDPNNVGHKAFKYLKEESEK